MLANTRLSVAAAVIGFAAYFTGTYVRTYFTLLIVFLILMYANYQKLYALFWCAHTYKL
jgi:hypothetical protein